MNNNNPNKDAAAFACAAMNHTDSAFQPGLTKREYFAGLAMQGLLSNYMITERLSGNSGLPVPSEFTKQAIQMADDLLNELSSKACKANNDF